jgi:hypothetical protein
LASRLKVSHCLPQVVGIGEGHSVSALDVEAIKERPFIAIECMPPSSRASVETAYPSHGILD